MKISEVWNKENLSDRDRSLVNLGMIAALNRSHEFKLHVRGALNNGLTRLQIRDSLLHFSKMSRISLSNSPELPMVRASQ